MSAGPLLMSGHLTIGEKVADPLHLAKHLPYSTIQILTPTGVATLLSISMATLRC
jgi:hypothetical protein